MRPQEPREQRCVAAPPSGPSMLGHFYFFARFILRALAQRRAVIRARPSGDKHTTLLQRCAAPPWLPLSRSRISAIFCSISARCTAKPARA